MKREWIKVKQGQSMKMAKEAVIWLDTSISTLEKHTNLCKNWNHGELVEHKMNVLYISVGFSLELGFKSLIAHRRGEYPKGHKITFLYDHISDEDMVRIAYIFNDEKKEFCQLKADARQTLEMLEHIYLEPRRRYWEHNPLWIDAKNQQISTKIPMLMIRGPFTRILQHCMYVTHSTPARLPD